MGPLIYIAALVAAGLGAAAGYKFARTSTGFSVENEKKQIQDAHDEAKAIHDEAKARIKDLEKAFDDEEKSMEKSLERMEALIKQKEEVLERREERNTKQREAVEGLEKDLHDAAKKEVELRGAAIDHLAKSAKMTREKAVEHVKEELDGLILEGKEARQNAELEEWSEDLLRHAQSVIQLVIQRMGVHSSVDKNNTHVTIADDRFKGLLIGKNGANIEYLEQLLPIAVIFNHGGDPSLINVTGLNLFRRNIGKRAIARLQKAAKTTGKIDPEMIKQAVEEAEAELMKECDQKGEITVRTVGLDPATTPPEVKNFMGRLYYRTSYGQNQMFHSMEAGYFARMIAELIGVNIPNAHTAAFYHDLGKAIDHDTGGSHDEISAEVLERNGYNAEIVHGALVHHGKGPDETPTDYIVKAADAISGARPGARMESVTNYFERMKELEMLASGFEGVAKVLTMSAGREVRVMVNKDSIHDGDMLEMAEQIANKISEEVAFPGIIKVNVIRQTKSVDYAQETKRSR